MPGSSNLSIFYVDDQEDIVWSTTKLLARKRPDLKVLGFTEPAAALDAMKLSPPNLLVTDLRMEEMSGLELLVAARQVVPDLPVIVVTAYGGPDVAAALHGRSRVEYLEKPIRADLLIASIDRLMTSGGFSGALSLPMLPDLIQVCTLSQTTGAMTIRRGSSTGTIWFDEGKIVHALCGDLVGEPAVYELLSWQGGEFALDIQGKAAERTITTSWQEVLLEGCRLLDEGGREAVSDNGGFEDDDLVLESQVAVPEGLDLSSKTSAVPAQATTSLQSDLAECLASLAKVDGFVGAALYDGQVTSLLGPRKGKTPIDLKAGATSNAEVLALLQSMMNGLQLDDPIADIVITLRKQYHLLRPVSENANEGEFVYLVLDRKQGDLALARRRLEDAGILVKKLRQAQNAVDGSRGTTTLPQT